jgi:RHS repeat-associated protein
VPGRLKGYSFNGSVTLAQTLEFDSSGRVNSVRGDWGASNTTFSLGYATGTDWVNSVTNVSYARSLALTSRYDAIASATTTWAGAQRARFTTSYGDARGYRNQLDNGDAAGTPTESWSKKLGLGDGYKQTLAHDDYGRLDKNTGTPPAWQNTPGSQILTARQADWNYDLAGNRSGSNTDWGGATTYTADNLNRYSNITGAKIESSLAYDSDANLTQDGTWTYAYDGENRLRSMTRSGEKLLFTYDYLGRRVRKDVFGSTQGLWGEYFNNVSLTGLPALTRTDSTVNFAWSGASPGPGVNGTNISVRWTGSVTPTATGTWTFYTDSDDGVRLWVNGTLLIDNWTYHGTTVDSGTISLEGGKPYAIRMEWFQGGGGSVARLHWSGPAVSDQTIPASALGSPTSATQYLYSGWNLVADLDGKNGGACVRSYIHGPDFSDAQGSAGGAGALLGQYSGGTLTYAVPDVRGSIVGYLNTSGNFNAAREYSLYGERINSWNPQVAFPIGYSGQYTDEETGLIYYGLRYYSPKHGRFINRDPIEEAGGNNLFAFVGNAPTSGWDVRGLCFGIGFGIRIGDRGFNFGIGFPCGSDSTWQPPPPVIYEGSYSRPTFGNLGSDRDWRKFDPRKKLVGAANSGGTEADRRGRVTPVYTNSVSLVFGTIEWGAESRGQSGANFFARFKPGPNCTCENISFIQVTLENTTGGTRLYPDSDKEGYYEDFASESAEGARVDHIEGDVDPYYGAVQWTIGGPWVTEGPGQLGSGPRGIDATMRDGTTVSTDARSGLGAHNKRFEACAVCIDTGEIYGCVRWGFTAADAPGSPAVVTGASQADFTSDPSREWGLAVAKWNGIARVRGLTTFP